MKLLDTDHYAEKLKEFFPEIDIKSIRDIIYHGNRTVIQALKPTSATVKLTGKSVEDGETYTFMMYKYNSIGYNNKSKFNKRLKDKRNDSTK